MMNNNFSAEFLKVMPPETSFGNAWESLCYDLLFAEHGNDGLQRLNAPDCGIDILRRKAETAIQCKSDERGSFGSLSAGESVKSLKAAVKVKNEIPWQCYTFASNANYTGSAYKNIMAEGNSLGIDSEKIEFLGPEYWNELCSKYFERVRERFDYRVTVTEEQVIEAFRKARYFDKYVDQYAGLISKGDLVLKIKNNRTPIELEFPFSPELTVENCVDAIRELLGISLKWTNFSDLGTSTGPSISLTVDQYAQSFKQTIGEIKAKNPGKELEFWIKLVWKDKPQDKDKLQYNPVQLKLFCRSVKIEFHHLERQLLKVPERKQRTLERAETLVQSMIWDAARKLKNPGATIENT
ncbi:MAG: hypothetical protein GY839_00470 [candidate division Zixibacteria bacterium]|nr:hypothetical protein [candidate division Zixibacteria bacterium]